MANLLIALLVTILLVTQRARVKGTTLVASWIWTAVSIWSIAMVQFFESSPEVNYCASVLVFCPVMSTLGARRPQTERGNSSRHHYGLFWRCRRSRYCLPDRVSRSTCAVCDLGFLSC